MASDAGFRGARRGSRLAWAPPRPFTHRIPLYAYAGVALNALAWAASWGRLEFAGDPFFFLWLGFILVLDGLNVARTGTSPLRRGLGRFVMLFVYSAPFWWLFEVLNVPVQNWHYNALLWDINWPDLIVTSLDFSTVLPAVMELAELLASVDALRPRLAPPQVGPRLSRRAALGLVGLGLLLLWLLIQFPTVAFGAVWLCLIFLLDPLNNLAGRKSAFGHLLAGDWRFIVLLPLAALCCGFFWEMWNYWSIVRWSYSVPGMDQVPHLFAMPLPGYLGYLPFGVELFVMYQFALLLTGRTRDALAF